ncbi:hypothetical protein M885DRAFT_513459 [Pelagophyceae sp. CCMP2097]|nr:hypothetical protein M885DRAFT_513459 [Pelagophyceae sp. CCMP2097]
MRVAALVALGAHLLGDVCGFAPRPTSARQTARRAEPSGAPGDLHDFLRQSYPQMAALLKLDETLWSQLSSADGLTVFAANAAAFDKLGDKRSKQLDDPRNDEVASKVAKYHVVGDRVSMDALRNSGGVMTLGGELACGESTSGGFMGIGGKPNGGVNVGSEGKVIQSFEIGNNVVHEVDALVSPLVLWRFADALRLPGSA